MTYCGTDCCAKCGKADACGGCEKCAGHPFGGSCIAERNENFAALKKTLIGEINSLRIGGLEVNELYLLNGEYVNLEYPLPGGGTVGFLNDRNIYLGCQTEREGSERCYGVVADEGFILVCEYGCGGSDPEIVLYKRR